MHKKKGFITIAIGEYYRYLALNLVKTYKLYGGKPYPFVVVSDVNTSELNKHFDHVVIENSELNQAYLYKLNLLEYSPFFETIFIDADCLITDSIDWYWEKFSNCDFGVFGRNTRVDSDEKPYFNTENVNRNFDVSLVPRFNGGIYFVRKSERGKKIINNAKNLSSKYDYYGLPRIGNSLTGEAKKNDEMLIGLSMAINDEKAVRDSKYKGMWHINGGKKLNINLSKRGSSFNKNGIFVKPSIVHFGTDNTKRFHYKREVKRLSYIKNGDGDSVILKIQLTIKKVIYIIRVQIFRLMMLNPSLDDLIPVHDSNERRIFRQFYKLSNFLKRNLNE